MYQNQEYYFDYLSFESVKEVKQFLENGEWIETDRWEAYRCENGECLIYFKGADEYIKYKDLDKLAESVYSLIFK